MFPDSFDPGPLIGHRSRPAVFPSAVPPMETIHNTDRTPRFPSIHGEIELPRTNYWWMGVVFGLIAVALLALDIFSTMQE
jgi:hypothetical protein